VFRGVDRQKSQAGPPVQTVALANEQGEVSLQMPPWSSGTLLVDAPGCALRVVALPSPLTDMNSQQTRVLTEKLAPAYFIRGVTSDEKGAPLGGVQVAVTSEYAPYAPGFRFNDLLREEEFQTPELSTPSAANGSFSLRGFDFSSGSNLRLNLSNAQINLLALSRRNGTLSLGVARADWKAVRDASLRLRLNPEKAVRGRVFDSVSGQPVPNVELEIRAQVEAAWGEMLIGLQMPSSHPVATTDAQGRFELTVIPPVSSIEVQVKAPQGFWNSTISVPEHRHELITLPNGELQVPLHRVVSLQGQVADAQAGTPVVPVGIIATVEDHLAGGWTNRIEMASSYDDGARVSPDGKFEMKAPVGSVNLEVRGPNGGNGKRVYQAHFSQNLGPRNTGGVNLTINRTPSVVLHWSDAPDPDFLSFDRPFLVAQVRSLRSEAIEEHISNGPFWMFFVSKWGDALEVRLIKRSITQEKGTLERELMPWTAFVSNGKQRPFEVHLPKDALASMN